MAPAISKPLPSDLVAQIGKVPLSHDRPDLAKVDNHSGAGIPLIDLNKFNEPEQLTNHGVAAGVMEAMLRVEREFLHLPESETPLVGSISRDPTSLSTASSSPAREPAASSNPSGGDNAARTTAGLVGMTRLSATSPPRPQPPAPPATTAPTTEDVSKLDLAIMACGISLVVPVALNMKDLTSSWDGPWKELYGVLMIVSLASTVTGFFTAWCPAVSWGRRLSPSCARFGLVDASALFIVFLACKLGRFGCAAGVGSAALVVLVFALVWAWSERPATGRAEAAAAVLQDGAGLPHDVP